MLSDPEFLREVVRAHRAGVAAEVQRNRVAGCVCGCAVGWHDVASTWRLAARTTAVFLSTLVRI